MVFDVDTSGEYHRKPDSDRSLDLGQGSAAINLRVTQIAGWYMTML